MGQMNVKNLTLVVLASLSLAACASGAKPGAMMVPVTEAALIDASSPLYKAIAVGNVTGGKKTNPMWTSEVSNEAFIEALTQSLSAHTMLAVEGAKYQLTAELLEVKQPLMGFNLTVTSKVKYTLTAVDGGAVLFQKEIVTPYTAKMGEAFVGVERLRLANEGSIRTNIQDLINALMEEAKSNPALQPAAAPVAAVIRAQLLG